MLNLEALFAGKISIDEDLRYANRSEGRGAGRLHHAGGEVCDRLWEVYSGIVQLVCFRVCIICKTMQPVKKKEGATKSHCLNLSHHCLWVSWPWDYWMHFNKPVHIVKCKIMSLSKFIWLQTIKETLDKKLGGPWHVVAGTSFSYDVTHKVWLSYYFCEDYFCMLCWQSFDWWYILGNTTDVKQQWQSICNMKTLFGPRIPCTFWWTFSKSFLCSESFLGSLEST